MNSSILENKKALLMVGLVVIAALAIIFLVLTGGEDKSVDDGRDVVTLGVITPLGGSSAGHGQETKMALDYYLTEVNKKSDDIRFVLSYKDGDCDEEKAADAYKELKEAGVKFILGGLCSSETLAIAELTKADDGKILSLSAASTSPRIEGASDYTFSLVFSDKLIGMAVAEEVNSYNNVVIITEENAWNERISGAFKENAATQPIELTFRKNQTDLESVVEEALALNPDAIFLNPNLGETAAALGMALQEAEGASSVDLFGNESYIGEAVFSQLNAGFFEGMIVFGPPAVSDEAKFAKVKEAIESSSGKKLDNQGDFYIATAIDSLDVLTDLIISQGEDVGKVLSRLTSERVTGQYSGTIGLNKRKLLCV